MSKRLFIIVILLVLAVPATTFAWSTRQEATPIVGADCRTRNDGNGWPIKPIGQHDDCSVTVYRFTDNGNICYVVKGSNAGGIYCVK